MFSEVEARFLREQWLGRLATVAPDGMPHVVPVGYAFDGTFLYTSAEPYKRRIHYLRLSPRAALVVDDVKPRRAILIRGAVEILEHGTDFQQALGIIVAERGTKWGFREGEQVILRLRPTQKVSWGLEVGPPA